MNEIMIKILEILKTSKCRTEFNVDGDEVTGIVGSISKQNFTLQLSDNPLEDLVIWFDEWKSLNFED